jgi:methylthioribose-1-phosphate isomerase
MITDFHFKSSLWVPKGLNDCVEVIDQRSLPFKTRIFRIKTLEDACFAIREMVVRGAPLIGVTAAYGMYLALFHSDSRKLETILKEAQTTLNATRPTAVNLFAATQRMNESFNPDASQAANITGLWGEANLIRQEEIDACRLIGEHGLPLIEKISRKKKGGPVNILTHCNAGWLACVEWGTATAPIYLAHQKGIPVHVWVDETRPRNQGARLTAFELGLAGISHTVIPDNTGGYLMQRAKVDMIIVGSDRTTRNGDVANKIGTYLKALAAADNCVPFYVALPTSTFDMSMDDGINNIQVEERDADEVAYIEGWDGKEMVSVRLIPDNSPVANYGFDITPARLVTGLITEKGICKADKESIVKLFKEPNF